MANDYRIQNDFSGGEISLRMAMRTDTEIWAKAAKVMENFTPTLQGSVERVPGTRFVEEITSLDARILPYLSPTNERSLVKITASSIEFIPDITNRFETDAIVPPEIGSGLIPIRRQIVANATLHGGLEPWIIDPAQYFSENGDGPLGTWWQGATIVCHPRLYHYNDIITSTISHQAVIPKDTAVLTVAFKIRYAGNNPLAGGYDCFVKLGSTAGASDHALYDFKDFASEEVGGIADVLTNTGTLNLLEDDVVHITVVVTAKASATEQWSTPRFFFDRLQIWADDEVAIGDGTIFGTVPYAADELADLHYVQSPLMPLIPDGVSKELVVTHPNHPPYKLFYSTLNTRYQFDPIIFNNQPVTWVAGNYPATCGSYVGRLVLAGSQGKPDVGSPIAGDTETVWCTEVGNWNTFSGVTDVNPDDSVEFTTTYRSPIRWVYGQKDLLIGALEMEYIASADGIYSPADLGVQMHSTHGSKNVQPAGFGENVFFPAEGGTKVRSMSKSQDSEGWLAKDMTIANPDICSSGIVRMVRMRNPHQMLVCLLNTGQLAVLHYDEFAGVMGWSRINAGANIKDIAVMANEEGEDILFVTVVRQIGGVRKLYLEAFANWVDDSDHLGYLMSSVIQDFAGSQSFMDGLDHLEGRRVQVTVDGGDYVGTYLVTAGQIDFLDELGNAISYSSGHAGLPMSAELHTLPLVGVDPTSKKRYSKISVQIRSSIIPKIGVQSPTEVSGSVAERAPTRSAQTNLGENSARFILRNVTVANMGWSEGQTVQVIEDIPQRVEILGVFGKLTSNSI
jgi:hypothetical protein